MFATYEKEPVHHLYCKAYFYNDMGHLMSRLEFTNNTRYLSNFEAIRADIERNGYSCFRADTERLGSGQYDYIRVYRQVRGFTPKTFIYGPVQVHVEIINSN